MSVKSSLYYKEIFLSQTDFYLLLLQIIKKKEKVRYGLTIYHMMRDVNHFHIRVFIYREDESSMLKNEVDVKLKHNISSFFHLYSDKNNMMSSWLFLNKCKK